MGFPRSRQLFEVDLVMASGPFLPIRDPSLGRAWRGDRKRQSHRHGILAERLDGVAGSFFRTAAGAVMMWQPTSSASITLKTSRVDAQMTSTFAVARATASRMIGR